MNDFDNLVKIVKKLRSPEGCPWDREQTHESLKPYMIEEAYETVEAIDEASPAMMADELGDVLLQVVLHSQIAEEERTFSIGEVVKGISDKMIRRHPHVFSDTEVSGSAEVLTNWERIKREEKKNQPEKHSVLDAIQPGLPALYRASKIQRKAAGVGFDWPEAKDAWSKVKEEIGEFEDELDKFEGNTLSGSTRRDLKEKMVEEFGDVLFSLVNVARKLDFDAEDSLRLANKKFIGRFHFVEKKVAETKKPFVDFTLEELDDFWDQAKALKK